MPETWQPRDYQLTALQWLLDRKDACLFAEMGLGKTVVTLTAIERLIASGECRGALVVAPIRVGVLAWAMQIERWEHLRWMRFVNMRTPEGIEAWKRGQGEVFFINPDQLATVERRGKKLPGWIEKHLKGNKNPPVDIFVLDESSVAKSNSSIRFKQLRPFLHDIDTRFKTPFKRRWALTGTPAGESYLALHNQILLIDGGKRLGPSFWSFRQTFFQSDYMGFKWTIRPGSKETIDAKLADLCLVLRSEDHLDLPPTEMRDIDVELPEPAMKAYRKLQKEFLVQLATGEIEALTTAVLVNKLAQFTAGTAYSSDGKVHVVHDAKLKALEKIRKDHPKEPLLVMTSYIHERERLLEHFPEAKEFDEKRMDDWKAGRIPMWVGHAASLCHGIDGLQRGGRIIVWMTLPYSNETFMQANARLVRIGQDKPTLIYRVMASKTVDWAIAEALRGKQEQQSALMTAVKALQRLEKL